MNDMILPPAIASDERFSAMAQLLENEFSTLDIASILVYLVDVVDREHLTHLAEQFHVMGFEGWDYTVTDLEKRALIKNAIELHRYKGTRWAVERVLNTLNMIGTVTEWFEYGGKPYHFKISIDASKRGISQVEWDRLVILILHYKNKRSFLEGIDITIGHRKKLFFIGIASSGEDATVMPKAVKNIGLIVPFTPKAGTWIFEKISVYPRILI